MTRVRTTTGAFVVGGIVALVATSAGAIARTGPRVYWRSVRNATTGHPNRIDVIRPRYHRLLSDRALRGIRWSTWGPTTATGRGELVSYCYSVGPNGQCRNRVQHDRLTLSHVRGCLDGRAIFSRLLLTQVGRPGNRGTFNYDCHGRSRAEGTTCNITQACHAPRRIEQSRAAPSHGRHGAPDPHAKLIRVGYCYEIKAEGSRWVLQTGTCGDMKAYILKYFRGTTHRCKQPGRNRVVCHIAPGTITSAVRKR